MLRGAACEVSVVSVAVGDGWIGLTLAKSSGLVLAGRVGKRTDAFITELIVSTARLD